jgi:hypothetical protein
MAKKKLEVKNKIQCQGYRRHGGAFTFGPVTWKQCTNDAIVMLTVKQEKAERLPACNDCWKECIEKGIKIIKAEPI